LTGPGKSAEKNNCQKCGKRIDTNTRAGSLTSYLFQNLNCSCGTEDQAEKLHPIKSADNKDFCQKCGLRSAGEVRAGSITGFLFQDIRCKCPADDAFSSGSMTQKLWKLKQADSGNTFSDQGRSDTSKPTSKTIGLAKGAIIGGAYKIIKLIGRGGMGEVYLAEHQMLDKRCALKVIPPEQVTEIGWLRFQTEAKAVAKLDHVNIVQVSDLGIHDGCLPYYAMEYVDGRTMADLIQDQGPMPLKTALDIFDQVCDGLDYSHRNGIIHRDIKPANIMLSKGVDKKISVKVLDFGLAKLTQQDRDKQSLTSMGEVLGSPFYMSPEQCEGGRIDRRSDIYSLGCTLFECLVGSPPFEDNLPAVIVRKHLTADAPSLESVVGASVFPDSLEVVLAKLLRKNPVERYQTMAELRGDLRRVAKGESVLPFYMSRSNISGGAGRTERGTVASDQARGGAAQKGPLEGQRLSPKVFPMPALVCGAAACIGGAAWYTLRPWFAAQSPQKQPAEARQQASQQTDPRSPQNPSSQDGKKASEQSSRQAFEEVAEQTLKHASDKTTGKNSQLAPPPEDLPLKVPASAQDTKPFCTLVQEDRKKTRFFDFPRDVNLGMIRATGGKWQGAQGARVYPFESYIEFMPYPAVVDFPGYLKRFRSGDIQAIEITNSQYRDTLIQALALVPGIRRLTFDYCTGLNDKDVQAIDKFDSLEELIIDEVSISAEDVAKLSCLDKLKALKLESFKSVDPILAKLRKSQNLNTLICINGSLSKSGMQNIATLPNLKYLALTFGRALSVDDFHNLDQLPKLLQLTIRDWPVDVKSTAVLKSLKSLKTLNLYGNPISQDSLEYLRNQLPAVTINIEDKQDD
jgi:serine/threonine protein kinase